jgi:hypothetical protein
MKRMPTATELRELCSIDNLIDVTVINAERAARFGESSHIVEVPATMSMSIVKQRLAKAFPECRIVGRWFTRYIEIKWA